MAVKAAAKFRDYCRYDVSGPDHEIVGIDTPSDVLLSNNIVLTTQVDLIKLPTDEPETLVFMDFSRRRITQKQMTHDMSIWAMVYAFSGLKKPITYICIDLSEDIQVIKPAAVYFQPDEMENIGRTLNYLAHGIYKGINYQCSWRCKECKLCSKS